MNGGSFELVMANQVNASNNFAPDMNNTWNNTNIPANKYYDKYSYNTSMTSFSRGKLGDATREILTTNGVFSSATGLMPHASNSWFGRGGTAGYSYDGGPVSSIFAFEYYDSSSTVLINSASTRPVLTVVRDLPWLND